MTRSRSSCWFQCPATGILPPSKWQLVGRFEGGTRCAIDCWQLAGVTRIYDDADSEALILGCDCMQWIEVNCLQRLWILLKHESPGKSLMLGFMTGSAMDDADPR